MDIKKIIKDWFTGPDGETHDPARFLWIAGMLVFMGFSGWEVYKTGKFEMEQFSIGYGALLAAGAAGVKIKESTEPKASTISIAPSPAKPVVAQKVTQVIVNTDDDDDEELPKPPKG